LIRRCQALSGGAKRLHGPHSNNCLWPLSCHTSVAP
jgi:hypothetical protein